MPEPRVVLVTGGASGIGAAVATRRAAAGDHVVIVDRDVEGGYRVAAATGGLFVAADVASLADNERAVAAAVDRFGRLDVVHLNAGVPGGAWLGDRFSAEGYQRCVDVNLTGVVFGVQAALPRLRANGRGTIVVTSSLAGVMPAADLYYSATKHAVIGLVRSLAMLVAEEGITVNALCPGLVDTPIIAAYRDRLVTADLPIADPAIVADAFDHVLDHTGTGNAWVVAAGQELRPVDFPAFDL